MIALFAAALGVVQGAAQDTSRHVTWNAFVDTYYGYDFGRPAGFDRVFTTQAARHDEFNINLAYVAGSLTSERVRGRLALQAGTSVQSNYASEPAIGVVSGATLSRHIQEATAGARLAPSLWIDGGVYFSYIGLEGWISRDNPTYTRSLVAEYTPYYLAAPDRYRSQTARTAGGRDLTPHGAAPRDERVAERLGEQPREGHRCADRLAGVARRHARIRELRGE
jgi:putative OmpL-like beta-barrel porin-2